MKTTTPIFIVGSGRSGTRMLFKLFSGIPNVEAFHEYLCEHIQPAACKYSMGIISRDDIKKTISSIHGSAIHYTDQQFWIDASNKHSWIIEPLHELFPQAKFVHVVRDGRKVTSSFYHKLAAEIYDDRSVGILQGWITDPKNNPEPPPEKKYWWNIPQKGQPFSAEFPTYTQFQRICYHWAEITRVIDESFSKLPADSYRTYKLEDVVSSEETLRSFFAFLGIPYDAEFFEFAQTPQGVFFPMDLKINAEEQAQFDAICGKQMHAYGYTSKEVYAVKY